MPAMTKLMPAKLRAVLVCVQSNSAQCKLAQSLTPRSVGQFGIFEKCLQNILKKSTYEPQIPRKWRCSKAKKFFDSKAKKFLRLCCVSLLGVRLRRVLVARSLTPCRVSLRRVLSPCSVSLRRVTYLANISSKMNLQANFQPVYHGPRWVRFMQKNRTRFLKFFFLCDFF